MNKKIGEIIRDEEAVWEQRKFGDIVQTRRGLTYKPTDIEESGIRVLRSSNIDEDTFVYGVDDVFVNPYAVNIEPVRKNDILITSANGSSRLVGKHALIKKIPDGSAVHGGFMLLGRTKNYDFVNASMSSSWYTKFINVFAAGGNGAIGNLNKNDLDEQVILIPDDAEQIKIGEYFAALDNLITLHQRISLYFLKINTFVWEQRKLGDLVNRVTRKNQDLVSELPLTISAQYGLIDQNEFFDKRVASKDVSGYYLIENGEFAYNKSTSTDAPWGAIKRLDRYENGVLSTLYIVFGIKENNPVDSDFLVSYYSTNLWHKGIHEIAAEGARNHGLLNIAPADFFETKLMIPQDIEEQKKIGKYFEELERLITLHQRKPYFWNIFIVIDWEQRKLGELAEIVGGGTPSTGIDSYWNGDIDWYAPAEIGEQIYLKSSQRKITEEGLNKSSAKILPIGTVLFTSRAGIGKTAILLKDGCTNQGFQSIVPNKEKLDSYFIFTRTEELKRYGETVGAGSTFVEVSGKQMANMKLMMPKTMLEQQQIGEYFQSLDHLITLHHHKLFIINGLKLFTVMQCKCHLLLNISNKNKKTIKEIKLMPELERIIEEKLIDQLVYGDSQWTYREDLKTEEDLWRNFKYILEQNNKDRLNGESLSDAEFEQVKNQLQFSSFYKAGEWLVGENGKVMVHVQRDTEKLHLVVMNHEHIAGGSSVYEVINQYSALKDEDDYYTVSRNRRFDVTLMINGLPMIHIELKNRQHSYMDGFNQIKKYISEGKFTGIFSAVQMFVVSNGVDTKYFAAASDTDLNAKFMSGWVDEKNNPVSDYLDFAKSVLRIPEAHEMIARYTVLDRDAKRLIILRPYQIHAIESIREASKTGKSGFVWHTTGSGKTLTSVMK